MYKYTFLLSRFLNIKRCCNKFKVCLQLNTTEMKIKKKSPENIVCPIMICDEVGVVFTSAKLH